MPEPQALTLEPVQQAALPIASPDVEAQLPPQSQPSPQRTVAPSSGPPQVYYSHSGPDKQEMEALFAAQDQDMATMIRSNPELQGPDQLAALGAQARLIRQQSAVGYAQKARHLLKMKDMEGAARAWANALGTQVGESDAQVTYVGDSLVVSRTGPDGKPMPVIFNPETGEGGANTMRVGPENIDALINSMPEMLAMDEMQQAEWNRARMDQAEESAKLDEREQSELEKQRAIENAQTDRQLDQKDKEHLLRETGKFSQGNASGGWTEKNALDALNSIEEAGLPPSEDEEYKTTPALLDAQDSAGKILDIAPEYAPVFEQIKRDVATNGGKGVPGYISAVSALKDFYRSQNPPKDTGVTTAVPEE